MGECHFPIIVVDKNSPGVENDRAVSPPQCSTHYSNGCWYKDLLTFRLSIGEGVLCGSVLPTFCLSLHLQASAATPHTPSYLHAAPLDTAERFHHVCVLCAVHQAHFIDIQINEFRNFLLTAEEGGRIHSEQPLNYPCNRAHTAGEDRQRGQWGGGTLRLPKNKQCTRNIRRSSI